MSTKVKIIEGDGITRTTNPSKKVDGQPAVPSFDYLGRQVMTLHQVRGLLVTAYAQVTTGTPTVLLSGDADSFLDLLEISYSTNTTVVSPNVALRDDGTTVRIVDIPVDDTVQLTFPTPIPQNKKGGDWVIDMDDVTGTTLDVGAIFVKNS